MNDIRKTFERNITEDKILKLTRTKLLESFLKGSDYEEDYTYLKENLPEYLDALKVNDSWIDDKHVYREVRDNYFLLCQNTCSGNLILGEVKFDENGKVIFGRYDSRGLFSRMDSFIISNKSVLRGTIPDSEFLYPIKRSESPKSFYVEEAQNTPKHTAFEVLHYEYPNKAVITIKNLYKKVQIHVPVNSSEEIHIYVTENKADFPSTKYTNKSKSLKRYFTDLEEIRKKYVQLAKDDFSKNELATYLDIYEISKKFLKSKVFKTKETLSEE